MSVVTPEIDLEAITPVKVIDARGAACPGPLLEVKKGIGGIPVGSILELWSSDPVTKTDVSAWSNKVGHSYLGILVASGYERVFIRREK